jgi:hypothetical protein
VIAAMLAAQRSGLPDRPLAMKQRHELSAELAVSQPIRLRAR